MPTFTITASDGRQYQVTGDNQARALEALGTHLGEPSMAIVGADTPQTPSSRPQPRFDGIPIGQGGDDLRQQAKQELRRREAQRELDRRQQMGTQPTNSHVPGAEPAMGMGASNGGATNRYAVEIDGEEFEFEAPDEASLHQAIREVADKLRSGKLPRFDGIPVTNDPGRNSWLGTADTVMRGVADTMTFGLADEFAAGADALFNPLIGTGQDGASLSDRYNSNLNAQRVTDDDDARNRMATRITGQILGGIGTGVGLARNGVSLTANTIKSGAGLGRTAVASGVEGGVLGAAQGFGSGEGGFEQRLDSAGEAAKWGAGLGVVAPLAISGISEGVRRAITPFGTSPERLQAVQTLAREGVDVSAGQKTGSEALRYAESEIGGRRAADLYERQGRQFTRAALKRAGIDADLATPEVMDEAFTKIGKQFDTLGNRNVLVADRQLQDDLVGTWKEYMSMVNPNQRAPVIGQTMTDLNNVFKNNGALDGKSYQAVRSRLERAARGSSDPQLTQALRGMRSSLDDAMERSIAARNPDDLGAFRDVRNNYRNLLVLERTTARAGEDAAMGIISPAALRSATVQKQGLRDYARGRGDFGELARAGQTIMTPMPNSGTASRTAARNLFMALPAAIGAGAGASGGIPTAMMGALAGAAVPALAGRGMMNPVVQALLGNQVLPRPISPQGRAIINALVNGTSSAAAGRQSKK